VAAAQIDGNFIFGWTYLKRCENLQMFPYTLLKVARHP
jgi:hypothetical protein